MNRPRSLLDWLSYPRGVVATVFGLAHTFVMSMVMLFVAGVIRDRRAIDFTIIYLWCIPLLWLGGIHVEVRGTSTVTDRKKGFLIVFNHSSLADIPVLYTFFPRSFRFGAKIELFQIPFFGRAMKWCGVLPIDRRNRNKVMRIYDEAIARVEKGEAFALAPEGTRQKEASLGKFKRGPFEFGINAQMDLVPVVLAGVYDTLPRDGFLLGAGRWRNDVIMHILPPVSTTGVHIEMAEEITTQVRLDMDNVYRSLNQELDGR